MLQLARKGVDPLPSESAVYRCLVRAGVIDPVFRRRRREAWKRWERGAAMELWQMDVVHGFLLADGTTAKALNGVDDEKTMLVDSEVLATPAMALSASGIKSVCHCCGVARSWKQF